MISVISDVPHPGHESGRLMFDYKVIWSKGVFCSQTMAFDQEDAIGEVAKDLASWRRLAAEGEIHGDLPPKGVPLTIWIGDGYTFHLPTWSLPNPEKAPA